MTYVTLRSGPRGDPFSLRRTNPSDGKPIGSIAWRKQTYRPAARQAVVVEDWAGEVLEVDAESDSFLAKLVDANDAKPDRKARFRLDQVPPAFRVGFGPGQQFRWQVFAADLDESRRDWTSSIVFTAPKGITKGDLELARRSAEELLVLLGDADARSADL